MRAQFASSLVLLALLSGTANAATYCAGTGAQFQTALTSAAASEEADTIRISVASITVGSSTNLTVQGDLTIVGGYGVACIVPGPASASSTIVAQSGQFIQLLANADVTLQRLRFKDFEIVSLSDTTFDSDVVTGRYLVQRSAFENGASGLRLFSNHHDVRVENSLFTGSTGVDAPNPAGAGFVLQRQSSANAVLSVDLVNNTSVGNFYGYVISNDAADSYVPHLYNSIAYGNSVADLDLRLPVLVRNSVWATEQFLSGGALAGGSGANLSVDPQLGTDFKPIEPDSPVINSGNNSPPGGLASSDFDGGLRKIGVFVDRGAYESSVDNTQTYVVENTNNSGAGSLRQALLDANQTSLPKVVQFDIPGSCPRTIVVTGALPPITVPIELLGSTQPDSRPNDDPKGYNGAICIALNGGGTVATGLHFMTSAGQEMTVEGMHFSGFTSEGVKITGAGVGNVRGSAFGALIEIPGSPGFTDTAIRVQDAGGSLIGGSDPASRNLIARAAQAGIRLEAAATGRTVSNNLIGYDGDGTPLPNGIGITVQQSNGDVIDSNTIGNSTTQGIRLLPSDPPPLNTTISRNNIGYSSAFGVSGNGTNGVRIEAGVGHQVQSNSISQNGTDGLVVLAAARRVRLTYNVFQSNGLLAIDLSPDGVNPINLDVGATGANDQQNYPTLTAASGSGFSGTVSGNLQSANGTYSIQFNWNKPCDASGYGEGSSYMGETQVSITNAGPAANGSASFSAPVTASGGKLIGSAITAIAIDEEGNSSEMSACIPYQETAIFADGFENEAP